jgi:hypothetical protein
MQDQFGASGLILAHAIRSAPPILSVGISFPRFKARHVGFRRSRRTGVMHEPRSVERRNWISEADLKEGLALAQLMPGPLAAQLAIYLG